MNAHTIEYYDIDTSNESDPDPTFEITSTDPPTSVIAKQTGHDFLSLVETDEPNKYHAVDYMNDAIYGVVYITKVDA